MPEQNINLTGTEWNLVECLWDASPRTGREATDYLQKRVGWTPEHDPDDAPPYDGKGPCPLRRKRRDEGLFPAHQAGGCRHKGNGRFLEPRVQKGSVSMMMSAITKKQALTKEEIDELYAILREAEEAKK
jgi:BlaI family penicillinase repressor